MTDTEPKTLDEAAQQEIAAIARNHAKKLTEELREKGLLTKDQEVVWTWSDPAEVRDV